MYIRNEDTICAPATVPGTGAISVIRVSGPEALTIADKVITCRKGNIADAKGYTLKFGFIYNTINNSNTENYTISSKELKSGKNPSSGELVDEVLVSIFKAPHSYTGENSVEISCHVREKLSPLCPAFPPFIPFVWRGRGSAFASGAGAASCKQVLA